ncbi:MAG: RpiB/LacA/LacB family sugar-phosphate isomerase, partial [Synergistaceae bacterium]|nr:RpiB/LacA/LacB family sugar-phosphate isomerase [Synergistaceae bacterium]
MKIAIGCDHAGYVLKDAVVDFLRSKEIEMLDLGAYEFNADDDYTAPAFKVGGALLDEEADAGILLCGTGFGVAIAANKIPGVRAVPCNAPQHAKMAKAHNNANVITMGGNLIKPEDVGAIIET